MFTKLHIYHLKSINITQSPATRVDPTYISFIYYTYIATCTTTIACKLAYFVWNSFFFAAVISNLEERALHSSDSLDISCWRRSSSRSSSCLSAPGTSGGGAERSLTFSWASERSDSVSDNLVDFNSRVLASMWKEVNLELKLLTTRGILLCIAILL